MIVIENLNEEQYGLLFDIRRSIRYHDIRKAFYEKWHRITNFVTILMAGFILFDMGKYGHTAWWLLLLGLMAALFATLDMVIGFSKMASLHQRLKNQFSDLEIKLLSGSLEKEQWNKYQIERLEIEKNEPPVYVALDSICRNSLLIVEGYSTEKEKGNFVRLNLWHKLTAHFYHWDKLRIQHY